jgi:hypothetical protein
MTPQTPPPGLILIGWQEHLSFPEWGVGRVRVKIDTGACTSALDVAGLELTSGGPTGLLADLRLALHRRHPERLARVQTPVLRTVVVRNSTGDSERRPVVEALVRLGPLSKRIRLTLTRRNGLRFRMILGREALAGCFLVDVSRKYLLRP